MVRFDVAVIGLGAVGSAALHYLAEAGATVVGLDRFSPPHALGSSHGGSRITRHGIGEGTAYTPLALRSHALWRSLEAETGDELLVACGLLVLAPEAIGGRGAAFLDITAATASRHGIEHAWLDGPALAERFPHFLGTADHRGYFEPGAGRLAPERCVGAQLQAARRRGAAVMTGCAVKGVAHHGNGVRIETDKGAVTASRALVAAGAWTGRLLGAPFDRLLKPERQVQHWFELSDKAPASWTGGPAFIRVHGDGTAFSYGFAPTDASQTVKLGSHNDGPSADPDTGLTAATTDEARAVHRAFIEGSLAGVRPTAVRSEPCFYTMTPDGHFIVDRMPGAPRIHVVSACSGHGFKHAAALGEAMAATMTDRDAAVDLAPFALSRFDG
jgi:sarcosine oxidase